MLSPICCILDNESFLIVCDWLNSQLTTFHSFGKSFIFFAIYFCCSFRWIGNESIYKCCTQRWICSNPSITFTAISASTSTSTSTSARNEQCRNNKTHSFSTIRWLWIHWPFNNCSASGNYCGRWLSSLSHWNSWGRFHVLGCVLCHFSISSRHFVLSCLEKQTMHELRRTVLRENNLFTIKSDQIGSNISYSVYQRNHYTFIHAVTNA